MRHKEQTRVGNLNVSLTYRVVVTLRLIKHDKYHEPCGTDIKAPLCTRDQQRYTFHTRSKSREYSIISKSFYSSWKNQASALNFNFQVINSKLQCWIDNKVFVWTFNRLKRIQKKNWVAHSHERRMKSSSLVKWVWMFLFIHCMDPGGIEAHLVLPYLPPRNVMPIERVFHVIFVAGILLPEIVS